MAYSSLLQHRALIKRRMPGVDRFKQPTNQFADLADDVPCRLSNAAGRIVRTNDQRGEVRAEHSLYFMDNVDITEDDIVTVRDRAGTILAANLQVILRRPVSGGDGFKHHVEVPCTLFRSPVGEVA